MNAEERRAAKAILDHFYPSWRSELLSARRDDTSFSMTWDNGEGWSGVSCEVRGPYNGLWVVDYMSMGRDCDGYTENVTTYEAKVSFTRNPGKGRVLIPTLTIKKQGGRVYDEYAIAAGY